MPSTTANGIQVKRNTTYLRYQRQSNQHGRQESVYVAVWIRSCWHSCVGRLSDAYNNNKWSTYCQSAAQQFKECDRAGARAKAKSSRWKPLAWATYDQIQYANNI